MELIHVGLGAFHRAHQAWYTQHADPDARIWAFTGRRPDAARLLSAQECRYTLVERSVEGDRAETIEAISRASAGDDHDAWAAAWRQPELAVVTLTITEKGYLASDADSAMGRLAAGLDTRRRAGLGPVAIMSCDNLTANGARTRAAVLAAAAPQVRSWIEESITFPATMVDRITPATTERDLARVEELVGWPDLAPVITEPFSEWVIAGEFPAGRPAWEQAGAQIVGADPADVEPYESRKLWLLNGSHSLLAYLGLLRGHQTVADAMSDPVCEAAVEQLWSEAAAVLPFDDATITDATDALRRRYANAAISHRLAQIAGDGSQKLGPRVLEVHRQRRAAGLGPGEGAATLIAAWILHLVGDRSVVNDPRAEPLVAELGTVSTPAERTRLALATLDESAAADQELVDAVVEKLSDLSRG